MAGLPGTGKSTVARGLAKKTAGCVLSKDEIRAALFAPDDIEYSTAQDDFCMEIMLQAASFLFRRIPIAKFFWMVGHFRVDTRSTEFFTSPMNWLSLGKSWNVPVPRIPRASGWMIRRTSRVTETSRYIWM